MKPKKVRTLNVWFSIAETRLIEKYLRKKGLTKTGLLRLAVFEKLKSEGVEI